MPPYEASQMPLKFFINFFKNHGLFKLKNRPQWYTVGKRSKTYVDKIINQISGEYYKNYPINKITRSSRGIKIFYGGENEFFNYDKVVIATHADEALKLIEKPTLDELRILKKFKYRENIAIIHRDESIYGKSGITFGRQTGAYPILVGVPYHIPLETDSDILVTGHGMRSISGVELGLNINSVSQQQLEAIPGIGKKGAWRIISSRAKASRKSDLPFDTIEKAFIMSDLEMPVLAKKVLKI